MAFRAITRAELLRFMSAMGRSGHSRENKGALIAAFDLFEPDDAPTWRAEDARPLLESLLRGKLAKLATEQSAERAVRRSFDLTRPYASRGDYNTFNRTTHASWRDIYAELWRNGALYVYYGAAPPLTEVIRAGHVEAAHQQLHTFRRPTYRRRISRRVWEPAVEGDTGPMLALLVGLLDPGAERLARILAFALLTLRLNATRALLDLGAGLPEATEVARLRQNWRVQDITRQHVLMAAILRARGNPAVLDVVRQVADQSPQEMEDKPLFSLVLRHLRSTWDTNDLALLEHGEVQFMW